MSLEILGISGEPFCCLLVFLSINWTHM